MHTRTRAHVVKLHFLIGDYYQVELKGGGSPICLYKMATADLEFSRISWETFPPKKKKKKKRDNFGFSGGESEEEVPEEEVEEQPPPEEGTVYIACGHPKFILLYFLCCRYLSCMSGRFIAR